MRSITIGAFEYFSNELKERRFTGYFDRLKDNELLHNYLLSIREEGILLTLHFYDGDDEYDEIRNNFISTFEIKTYTESVTPTSRESSKR